MHAPALSAPSSAGARLVAEDGRALSFQGGTLRAHAAGGLARLRLEQRFVNPHREALQVTLQVPLPADAAVSGFSFAIGEERVVGQIDTRSRARERFEEAVLEGRTAALLEQDRSSLFRQRVGNVPPGEEVLCELVLDLPLVWEQGGWTLRFPTVVAPRFQGAVGRVADAARQLVGLAPRGTSARMGLELEIGDRLTQPVRSPSHGLKVLGQQVFLADGAGATLDRDLVLRWGVAAPEPGLSLQLARAGADSELQADAFGLLSIVPPAMPGAAVARDLVVLLDTSGSMRGAPLAQAKAVTLALIDSLGEADQLQIIEFSTRPRAWKAAPALATELHKQAARQWVGGLRAGGGTEMRSGILAALETLRDEAQRQVVLVTDGLIGFEREIVGAVAERLPRGCRVHTVGIGSAVNRSLLQPVARAGGGRELIIGLEEAAEEAAAALVAATAAPLVVDLELSGSALREVAHHRIPDLMAGRPVRVALRLDPEGGELVVRGHAAGAEWTRRLGVGATAASHGNGACIAIFGRELAEELELKGAQGVPVDSELEAVGLRFQVSTRKTSWVAVSTRVMVDPTAPSRSELVPQALPAGMSVEGLGLRRLGGPVSATAAPVKALSMAMPSLPAAPGGGAPPRPSAAPQAKRRVRRTLLSRARSGALPPPPAAPAPMADGPVQPAPEPQPAKEERAERSDRGAPGLPVSESLMAGDLFEDAEESEAFAGLEEELALDEAPAEAPRKGRAPAQPRLMGRIVLRNEKRLVIEILVRGGPLDWTLPATVQVQTGAGLVTLEVRGAGSTRSGRMVDGQQLRLVLAPLSGEAVVLSLRCTVGGVDCIVEMERG